MSDLLPCADSSDANLLQALLIGQEQSAHVHLTHRLTQLISGLRYLLSAEEWQILGTAKLCENHGRIDEDVDVPWKIVRHERWRGRFEQRCRSREE